MKRALAVWPLAAVVVMLTAPPLHAQRAVVLVRHAEKVDESDDPLLSAAGKARAQRLAQHLRSAGVTAIYVSQYKRTALTAAPLAALAGVKPVVLQSDGREELVARLRKDHAADVVLVVGHSDSVPELLRLMGHQAPVTIAHAEYDNLFVVVPDKGGPPRVLRLRY